MKKKILVFIGGTVVAVMVNLGFNSHNGALSDLVLANIEALAKGEDWWPEGTCDQASGPCDIDCPKCGETLYGQSNFPGPVTLTGGNCYYCGHGLGRR